MSKSPLVIITTRLPPQICGIGTYSWLLHRYWPTQNSPVQFLVIEGAAESTDELKFPAISEFSAQPSMLSRMLDRTGSADVLLHYAGRAYHRYGCPTWLPPALRKWKTKFPTSRLVIFFHELPGDNYPITSRFFWIDSCNRRIVGHLVRLADAIATNTREHVSMIKKISGRTDVHLVPVGSNIEPAEFSTERARTEFAIFGLSFGRWQTLEMFEDYIREWQENGRLTKLHLIGPHDEKFDRRTDRLIDSLPNSDAVVRHGFLSVNALSRLLGGVRFGLTNATIKNWSKSTTFMAYAAHGCAIVGKVRSENPPLSLLIHPEELPAISEVDLTTRAGMLWQWYRDNADWSLIAHEIADLFASRAEKVLP